MVQRCLLAISKNDELLLLWSLTYLGYSIHNHTLKESLKVEQYFSFPISLGNVGLVQTPYTVFTLNPESPHGLVNMVLYITVQHIDFFLN